MKKNEMLGLLKESGICVPKAFGKDILIELLEAVTSPSFDGDVEEAVRTARAAAAEKAAKKAAEKAAKKAAEEAAKKAAEEAAKEAAKKAAEEAAKKAAEEAAKEEAKREASIAEHLLRRWNIESLDLDEAENSEAENSQESLWVSWRPLIEAEVQEVEFASIEEAVAAPRIVSRDGQTLHLVGLIARKGGQRLVGLYSPRRLDWKDLDLRVQAGVAPAKLAKRLRRLLAPHQAQVKLSHVGQIETTIWTDMGPDGSQIQPVKVPAVKHILRDGQGHTFTALEVQLCGAPASALEAVNLVSSRLGRRLGLAVGQGGFITVQGSFGHAKGLVLAMPDGQMPAESDLVMFEVKKEVRTTTDEVVVGILHRIHQPAPGPVAQVDLQTLSHMGSKAVEILAAESKALAARLVSLLPEVKASLAQEYSLAAERLALGEDEEGRLRFVLARAAHLSEVRPEFDLWAYPGLVKRLCRHVFDGESIPVPPAVVGSGYLFPDPAIFSRNGVFFFQSQISVREIAVQFADGTSPAAGEAVVVFRSPNLSAAEAIKLAAKTHPWCRNGWVFVNPLLKLREPKLLWGGFDFDDRVQFFRGRIVEAVEAHIQWAKAAYGRVQTGLFRKEEAAVEYKLGLPLSLSGVLAAAWEAFLASQVSLGQVVNAAWVADLNFAVHGEQPSDEVKSLIVEGEAVVDGFVKGDPIDVGRLKTVVIEFWDGVKSVPEFLADRMPPSVRRRREAAGDMPAVYQTAVDEILAVWNQTASKVEADLVAEAKNRGRFAALGRGDSEAMSKARKIWLEACSKLPKAEFQGAGYNTRRTWNKAQKQAALTILKAAAERIVAECGLPALIGWHNMLSRGWSDAVLWQPATGNLLLEHIERLLGLNDFHPEPEPPAPAPAKAPNVAPAPAPKAAPAAPAAKSPAPAPAAAPKAASTVHVHLVNGMAKRSPEDRAAWMKALSGQVVDLVPATYEGEPAIQAVLNGKTVAWVAKSHLAAVTAPARARVLGAATGSGATLVARLL